MYRIISIIIISLALPALAANTGDSIPSYFDLAPQWRIGAGVAPACVPGTNSFLKGDNRLGKKVGASTSASLRADFSFNPETRQGRLYRGLYQGIGLGVTSFFAEDLLGTPVSAYVYQGAPIAHFGDRLWLGYEWQFGAAFGWKHSDDPNPDNNAPVSTAVTAHIGLGVRLHYAVSERWQLSFGLDGNHYSNGNTSWPNSGVNTLGASLGVAYVLNPQPDSRSSDRALEAEADRHRWMFDIMAFGAWRKRAVGIGEPAEATLCPGRFGIAGLQFAPLYRLNRWVAVGPALDMQWDESAGLAPYWVEGSYGSDVKFTRPPFGKQLSAGLSAHAELTMPIFAVNAGLGYDLLSPEGNKRFYQSLTLKTFVSHHLYINVGYRLGKFKEPQNLMLGLGVRL